jgi:hypothetical protein
MKTLVLCLAVFSCATFAGWDNSFESGFPPSETCRSILATSTTVYVGTEQGRLLKWTPAQGWSFLTSNFVVGPIRFLGLYGGSLYIGGDFIWGYNSGQWVELNKVARFDFTTGQFSTLGGGISGTLRTMVVVSTGSRYREDFLYVGGFLSQAGGNSIRNIAAWNGNDWYDLQGGLNVTSPPKPTDGVHSIVVYTGGSKHRVLVAGRFDLSPNVALFTEYSSGGSWTPAGSGLRVAGYDEYDNCQLKTWQGLETHGKNMVRLGSRAFMNTFETSWVNGFYEPVGCGNCLCGYDCSYLSYATASITTPYDLSIWDGGHGWINVELWSMWSNGSQIYAYADIAPFDGFYNTIAVYSSGTWIDLTHGGVTGGFFEGPNSMATSSLGLFLATDTPKRWQ